MSIKTDTIDLICSTNTKKETYLLGFELSKLSLWLTFQCEFFRHDSWMAEVMLSEQIYVFKTS